MDIFPVTQANHYEEQVTESKKGFTLIKTE